MPVLPPGGDVVLPPVDDEGTLPAGRLDTRWILGGPGGQCMVYDAATASWSNDTSQATLWSEWRV